MQVLDYSVGESAGLVLLLTPTVLHSPWVLLEVVEASKRRLPVVSVRCTCGEGNPVYDFAESFEFLRRLQVSLKRADPAADRCLRHMLAERGTSFHELQVRAAGDRCR